MPRGLLNWTYADVVDFLRERNFRLHHTRGSHVYYTGMYAGKIRVVTVPRHGSKSIKPRTMKGIVLQSGIQERDWTGKK